MFTSPPAKMASECPSKTDINAVFKRLKSNSANKQCFDCSALNPTWASVTYGVFLCIDCSAVHRSLGVHLTFIRSIQLDTSWSWLQLRGMQVGGNAAATAFFRQHGCDTNDAQHKYNSRAAQMYREKLHGLALKAMKLHGTKAIIDTHQHGDATSPQQKEVDFFKEHENILPAQITPLTPSMTMSENTVTSVSDPVPISNGNGVSKADTSPEDPTQGPNVDIALSMSPTEALQKAEPRKSTIGTRKPQSAKKGLGAKKGGLGAQKVKTNFSDVEKDAQLRDREKEEMAQQVEIKKSQTKEDEVRKMASMKLAYKDLNADEKKREEKMKNMDPKKAEQMLRLGMGMGGGGSSGSRGTTHSSMSEMTTIEQETPTMSGSSNTFDRYTSRNRDRDFDDDFEIISGGNFSSGPPKYDSPFSLKKEDRYSNWSSGGKGKSNWDNDRFDSKQSTLLDDMSGTSNSERDTDRGSRSRQTYEVNDSGVAQKKFGGAKSISSDAYFGNQETDCGDFIRRILTYKDSPRLIGFATKQTLTKFEGSSSISSSDFFNDGSGGSSSGGGGSQSRHPHDYYGNTGPDLQEIRDGMKQSVSKVAGKLSNIASGVMNSLQDNYG